jgi:hypothetical protein
MIETFHLKKFGFFAILLTFLFSCSPNIYFPLQGELSENDMVGTWSPTADSRLTYRGETICCGTSEIKLHLSEDGSFSLKNITDCWNSTRTQCGQDTLSYWGKWTLSHDPYTGDWHLLLTEETVTRSKTYSVGLIKRKGRKQICISYGDGDEGNEIYLDKD